MNKADIKQIILEEIKYALKEMGEPDPELYPDGYDFEDEDPAVAMAAEARPDEDEDIEGPDYEDYAPDPALGPNPSFVEEDLYEMARTPNVFKLSREASIEEVRQFMQRVNNVLKKYKSPGQKKPKKRFTPEEMAALADVMMKPEGFTSKDIIAATSYNSPAQANKFLQALEMKGLITLTSVLKKSMEPERDPNAPETRGRKPKSRAADMDRIPTPDDEDFDPSLYDGDFDMGPIGESLKRHIQKVIKETKAINEISLDKFAAAMSVAIERGEHKRAEQLSNTFFRNFIGKDFGEGLGKLEKAKLNTQSDKKAGIELGFEQDVRIFYSIENDNLVLIQGGGAIQPIKDLEIERGAVRKLQQIIKAINPESKIITGTSAFSVKGLREISNLKKVHQQIKEAKKSPLASKMKEIENQGRLAALETKLAAIQEMIDETNARLTRIDEDEEFTEMMDQNAVREVRKQLKELERAQAKLQKEYGKYQGKGMKRKKPVVGEDEKSFDEKTPEEMNTDGEFYDDDNKDLALSQAGIPEEIELNEGRYSTDNDPRFLYPDLFDDMPTQTDQEWIVDYMGDSVEVTAPNKGAAIKAGADMMGVPGPDEEYMTATLKNSMNESSILRMQKLAGLITENVSNEADTVQNLVKQGYDHMRELAKDFMGFGDDSYDEVIDSIENMPEYSSLSPMNQRRVKNRLGSIYNRMLRDQR